MIARALGRLVLWLGALAVLAVAGAAALFHADAAEPARRWIAEWLLEDLLEEPVAVTGPVVVEVGAATSVRISDVRILSDGHGDAAPPLGAIALSFPTAPALLGTIDLETLEVDGLGFRIDLAEPDPFSPPIGAQVADAVMEALTIRALGILSLRNLRIERLNDPTGWNGVIVIDEASTGADAPGGGVSLEVSGAVNGVPFAITGEAPSLRAPSTGGAVDLLLANETTSLSLKGALSLTGDGLDFEGALSAATSRLSVVQAALGLAEAIRGSARLDARLSGPLAVQAASALQLQVDDDAGRTLAVTGEVGDIWRADGLSLAFDTRLVGPDEVAGGEGFDPMPRQLSGRVKGGLDGVLVEEMRIQTGLASLQLAEIGPISIGGVRRGPEGQLRLEDIRLLQGDPSAPTLDVTAEIDDALAMRGFRMGGAFSLNLAPIFTGRAGDGGLGALVGDFAASDASGVMRIDALKAETRGSDLISLSLERTAAAGRGEEFDLALRIPEIGALAAAIGQDEAVTGAVGYEGRVAAGMDGLSLKGDARLGPVDVALDMALATTKAGPRISGALSSRDFDFASLSLAFAAADALTPDVEDSIRLNEAAEAATTVDLSLAAARIAVGDVAATDFTAALYYAGGRLTLKEIGFAIGGGAAAGAVAIETGADAPAVAVAGDATGIRLASVLSLLGAPPGADGPVDIAADLTARGGTLAEAAGTLTGRAALRISDGRLAKRAIELAGTSILSWAFTRSPDGGAPLTCLIADFDFQDGVGVSRKLTFETGKIIAVGGGKVDLADRTLSLVVNPKPKTDQLAVAIGPVTIDGPLDAPKVTLAEGAVAGKVLGETIGLPLGILGAILAPKAHETAGGCDLPEIALADWATAPNPAPPRAAAARPSAAAASAPPPLPRPAPR